MIGLVSCDRNWGIGRTEEVNGKTFQSIPWNWPADMNFFKTMTLGHRIIVGRKTFETLPKLRNRRILCVSWQNISPRSWYDWDSDTAFSAISILEAQQIALKDKTNDVFLCGGSELYKELMGYCTGFYISKQDKNFDCDIKFPHEQFLNSFESYPEHVTPIAGGSIFYHQALPF